VLAAVGHSCHPILFFVGTLLPLCTIKNRWKSIDIYLKMGRNHLQKNIS
jgi:hypothetical protein